MIDGNIIKNVSLYILDMDIDVDEIIVFMVYLD